jgi:predicted RNA-binding protein associated with RNAse of E/G family
MNYIEDMLYDLSEELPGLPNELLDLYGLLVAVKGNRVTLKDVHDAWAIWKNRIRPDHKSLIPFDKLTTDVQELDRKYANIIAMVSEDYNG